MTEPAIDTGEILEALNNKTDRDCRNVDTTSGADVVIEWQAPTSENNYTWYRKYKSGWVEQGGWTNNTSSTDVSVTLPITMQNSNYKSNASLVTSSYGEYMAICVKSQSPTTLTVHKYVAGWYFFWEVKGMSAQS